MEVDSSSRMFVGVHFVLYGFNSIDENEVRFKLLSGGGVDAGQYSQNCTHVIVDKLVYDDVVCVAARNDGKMLVTGLWVNHSYDLGAAVNAFSIMYRPVVDLNGIPGAERLTICLTGYQRQDRDDVMTMVSLMGAKFSKPLIAHKVTHLICYKFEGEKYELARRLKTIKLVNHRWLEDCLRHWVLLPEANYNTSGYDLENIELEAKDSEEESDNNVVKHIGVRNTSSPITLQPSSTLNGHLSTSVSGTSNILPVSTILEDPKNIDVAKHAELVPVDDNKCTPRRISSDIDISCSELADIHLRTPPVSKKISDGIVSPLSANIEDQSSSRSYSRRNPRKSALLHSVGRMNNLLDSPVPFSGSKVNHSFEPPLLMAEPEKKNNGFGRLQTPEKKGAAVSEEELINGLPQKRTSDRSNSYSLKSLSNPVNAEIERLKFTLSSLEYEGPSKIKSCDTSLPQNSPHRSLVAKPIFLPENSSAIDLQSSRTSTDLDGNVDKISQRSLQSPVQVVSEYEGAQNHQQDVKETSTSDKSVKAGKLKDVSIDFLEPENNSLGKSPRKNKFFKKSLGSRPKIGLTANQKGSIHFRKEDGLSNRETFSGEGNPKKLINAECVLSTGTVNNKVSKNTEIKEVSQHNIESIDDETEAPDNTEDLVLEKTEPSELKVHHESNNFQVGMLANTVASVPNVREPKPDSPVCARSTELDETKINSNANRKLSPKRKRSASKTKVRSLTSTNCKEGMDDKVIQNANAEDIKDKPLARARLKTKSCRTVPPEMSGKSIEVEKENRPIIDVNENVGFVKTFAEKPTGKSYAKSRKTKKTTGETNTVPVGSTGCILIEIKKEPAWFILSGHRLQKKMFQQSIKLLKGRFCRDSHQWSYQATHLIIPDPIRRTEKFFAATASGRWVLNADYLTASKQAGRFLEEEPYEWYKNGLSEDGAINLEAPRKWRHLRERTGHGAFYGMKIIIHGECIAPPLDTLKRVVKAGDGTILATSPPYTRFLTSEVDFAVVSPGMPRVDIWVQEFLKHEIPCVVADYLVEYVCKPGYPLEKHVLYNTQPWAEKSFSKLQNKAEEVAKVSAPENYLEGNDIACRVCRSRERGEVMLICGDESGSAGCGVGMHIDCCNPPLLEIPEDDWFCPECVSSKKKINSSKKRRR